MQDNTDYRKTPYYGVGRASDLTGSDRRLYRFFEMVPGLIAWITIIGTIILSRFFPVEAAIFIIIFDIYWLLKTLYLSTYLRQNWKRMKHNIALDWGKMLENLKYQHIVHLVILPFYKEGKEVIEKSIESLLDASCDKKKIIVVLASEARAGRESQDMAREMRERYADHFRDFLLTVHPADVIGEMPGKGSNITFAAEQARQHILNPQNIPYGDVLVSAFDIDTVVYPKYFQCLTWHFLTTENPYRSSFQPVPFYNNNIWDSPAFSRVVAASGTFWQMIQQERPERLATFSSHAISFKTLHDIGYWQKNMVSEDSRIFWNAYVAYDGDYTVVPLSYPVSMDANLAPTFLQTCKNIYKQQRRWSWGAENLPYVLMAFVKNKKIPRMKKIRMSIIQIEGYWSLATHPIMIFILGWLPVIAGGRYFNTLVLSYNLPVITRYLMDLSLIGLVLSAIVSFSFLPPPPANTRIHHKLFMLLQWVLVPVTILIFSALPGMDAQTRLMTGKYMGFWVTPKHRKVS